VIAGAAKACEDYNRDTRKDHLMQEQLNDPFDEILARIAAIALILVDKGICTAEETTDAVVISRKQIKQMREKENEKTLSELRQYVSPENVCAETPAKDAT